MVRARDAVLAHTSLAGAVILHPTAVSGVLVGRPAVHRDLRGAFARLFDAGELAEAGFDCGPVRCAVAENSLAGTLRGMHYQTEPESEAKLVTCLRGRILDVVVDLRTASPTYRQHVAMELDGESGTVLAIPGGCAHGYLTLSDDSLILYQLSVAYHAELQRGVRWDDPGLGVRWPESPRVISERDRTFPDHMW
jgi:dTDP-4-dehydrorhamnose 3,5-epimerase